MHKKIRLLLLIMACFPAPAWGEWRPWGSGAALRDAPVKVEPGPSGPLVLLARHLVIYEGEMPRRSFTLNTQNDALVDVAANGDTIHLATRRTLWRSDDRGFTWRKLVSMAPRDPDEWLAITSGLSGRTLAASRTGLKLIAPGAATSAGALGKTPIAAAHRQNGRLLVSTPRGLYAIADATAELPYSLTGGLQAYAVIAGEHWLADSRSVTRCDSERCAREADISDVTAIAQSAGSYWLASTDAVWRRSPDTHGWRRASEGLGAARPVSLRESGGKLYALTDRGLYAWFMPVTATTDPLEKLRLLRPKISEVRRMVLESIDELRAPSAANWRQRARWRAAAPLVGLSVRRNHDDRASRTIGNTVVLSTTENRILVGPDGESITDANTRGFDYGISLTWSLDDLVFNNQELSVSNEMEDLFRLRESILLDVTRLYFDRIRTLAQRERETDPLRRTELTLRASEIAAEIDFYTDGRFSRMLEEEP